MKHLLLSFALFSVLFAAEGFLFWDHSEEHDESCLKIDVQEYVDKVVAKARTELPDPISLPPKHTVVDLSDGILWGLSNLTRRGIAKVTCEDPNTVVIKTKLTTDELKGRYTWATEQMARNDKKGYVVFISNDFEAEVTVVIEKKEGEKTHPRLERFQINRFKDARIEITGKGFLTWALAEITTLMSGIFQRAIAWAVQGPVEETLQRHLRDIVIE